MKKSAQPLQCFVNHGTSSLPLALILFSNKKSPSWGFLSVALHRFLTPRLPRPADESYSKTGSISVFTMASAVPVSGSVFINFFRIFESSTIPSTSVMVSEIGCAHMSPLN